MGATLLLVVVGTGGAGGGSRVVRGGKSREKTCTYV